MNRLLSITRDTIPYIKELRPFVGSVTACILMQQLDYWFDKYPEGFYKFQSPSPKNGDYKPGDSWEEELGFSAEEFQTAFRRIGLQHKSKTAYELANDKFKGLFYCSYYDRKKGITWYLRNDKAVDKLLNELVSGDRSKKKKGRKELNKLENGVLQETGIPGLQETDAQETANDGFRKPGIPVSRGEQSRFPETINPGLHSYTEITPEITPDTPSPDAHAQARTRRRRHRNQSQEGGNQETNANSNSNAERVEASTAAVEENAERVGLEARTAVIDNPEAAQTPFVGSKDFSEVDAGQSNPREDKFSGRGGAAVEISTDEPKRKTEPKPRGILEARFAKKDWRKADGNLQPGFLEYVTGQMSTAGEMNPRTKARHLILNKESSIAGLELLQGYWDDMQAGLGQREWLDATGKPHSAFIEWIVESTQGRCQGQTVQQATIEAMNQLNDQKKAAVLWSKFKTRLVNENARRQEQENLGVRGYVAPAFLRHQEPTIEQAESAAIALDSASVIRPSLNSSPNRQLESSATPLNTNSVQRHLQGDLNRAEGDSRGKSMEMSVEVGEVAEEGEKEEENKFVTEEQRANIEKINELIRSKIKGKRSAVQAVPQKDRFELMKEWAMSSDAAFKNEAMRWAMQREDVEILLNENGVIVGLEKTESRARQESEQKQEQREWERYEEKLEREWEREKVREKQGVEVEVEVVSVEKDVEYELEDIGW